MQGFLASWRLYGRTDRMLRNIFGILAVLLPLLLWSAVSYLPFVWHPQVLITDPGGGVSGNGDADEPRGFCPCGYGNAGAAPACSAGYSK